MSHPHRGSLCFPLDSTENHPFLPLETAISAACPPPSLSPLTLARPPSLPSPRPFLPARNVPSPSCYRQSQGTRSHLRDPQPEIDREKSRHAQMHHGGHAGHARTGPRQAVRLRKAQHRASLREHAPRFPVPPLRKLSTCCVPSQKHVISAWHHSARDIRLASLPSPTFRFPRLPPSPHIFSLVLAEQRVGGDA